ncbi:DNA oxidative demethylase AlkB [Zavarzinia sp.]|uniref:DNA oxidative demethylase AlkB n=1 Tax=Zavarzinia sp. TaxID=2027920 RepID=UPI003564E81A
MTGDLFAPLTHPEAGTETIAPGAVLLRGFACAEAPALLSGIEAVAAAAPFRHMVTPGGQTMSVAMTCCGSLGWVTDRRGYRYQATDPASGAPWPSLPPAFAAVATAAAEAGGYPGFAPDACLINRYAPGARMGLHQDRDEQDFTQPIVSVSLGLPAVFLFGGPKRNDPARRIPLVQGDVVVWGGPSRLFFHGVAPLRAGHHPAADPLRYNLTFRRAGLSCPS